ncbi:MAG: hypothetical protein H0V88_02345 [Pyrinomonadaceae bacterium]|nr:hypothetical protein [Pyrinomonadaceae bacterium]
MQTPLIIGHRGASAVAPENTLAAFGQALTDGADGVEFDVRLSQDEVPVVIHDRDLRRTGLTNAKVSDLSARELGAIDVGKWFNLRYPSMSREEYEGATIPTLEEVLRFFDKTKRVLYVEMKTDKTNAHKLATEVVRCIREHDFTHYAVVESFALEAVAEVKRLAPEIMTAALFERKLSRPAPSADTMLEEAIACGASEIALHHTLARKRCVEKALQRGLRVAVWTVDESRWIKRAAALGINALITNDPAKMRASLDDFCAR